MTISITLTQTHTLAVSHDPYPYTLREIVRTERYPYPHTLQPMDHRYHTPLPNATLEPPNYNSILELELELELAEAVQLYDSRV